MGLPKGGTKTYFPERYIQFSERLRWCGWALGKGPVVIIEGRGEKLMKRVNTNRVISCFRKRQGTAKAGGLGFGDGGEKPPFN